MLLPTNIATGRVTGQFLAGVVDGVDDDQDPDAVPAAGFVTFTASVPYLPDPTASPNPATILTTSIVAVLDNEGYLCTPAQGTLEPSYRGVRLIATDDPDLSVEGWTWNATYSFSTVAGQKLAIPTHSFAVPSDGVVDLTTVVKVPSSAGIGTEQAEALAASAQAAAIQSAQDAATAAQAAVDAAAAAQVTDTGVAALVATPGSATALEVAGLVDESNAGKLNTDDAVGIYQSQAALDAAAAAKVNTDGTATNAAVKAVADTSAAAAAGPKLDATTAASTYAVKPDNGSKPIGKGELFINVADYLAVGDAATDDTNAIQAALTAAGASLSTKRVIGTGRLYVVSSVSVPDGVTLANIRLKHKAGSTAAALILSGLGSRADSVEVDGNTANQTVNVNGIEVSGERASVSNCYVHHIKWDGIIFTSNAKYGNAANNRVLTTGRYGITLTGSDVAPVQSVVIHGNHVESSTAAGLGIIGVANEVTFSSNTTRNTGGDGIAGYNGNNRRIVCIGNTFYAPANNGIHIAGTELVIANNAAYNVGQTAWFIASDTVPVLTPPSSRVTISNNVVNTVYKLGVWLQEVTQATVTGNVINNITTEHGINLTDCSSVVVNANEIGNAIAGRGVFLVRASNVNIANNRIHDCGLHGIYGRDYATGTIRCTNVIVTGNNINNTVGGIVSSESSDNWTVGPNRLSSITGTSVILAGANNEIYAPVPAVDPALRFAPTGALATTLDRRTVNSTSIASTTSGTMRLSAVWLTKGATVSSITYLSGGAAAGLTNRWFALFDANRGLLRTTADNSAAWSSGTTLTLPLTTSYVVPADGIYYIGFCEVATTPTVLRGATTSTNSVSISPVLGGDSGAGLTNAASTPATPPGGWTVQGGIPFAYVS